MNSSFLLTLAGYDGGTDTTDHLIKWVKAPSRAALDAYIAAMGYTLQGQPEIILPEADLSFEDGVDVILDEKGVA